MSDKPNPYDLNEVGEAQRERAGALHAARGILGPRPDDEEPPEVTIRRGRGDSDAELYDYMRKLWAEQKTDNARLKAELAAVKARRCETCRHCWQPVRDGTFKWGRCDKWAGGLEVRADACCPDYEPKEAADAES